MRARRIISKPDLKATLQSLEPGDFVRMGKRWSYGTIRTTAYTLKIKDYRTEINDRGITFYLPKRPPIETGASHD